MREINRVYVPVYTELLRRPVYAKYFDARTLGTLYRVLSAHIWRLDSKETSSSGYRGTVFKTLATEYENGNLVCYFDDKALADMLGVTKRYIRKLRNQLQGLGLIEARQVESKAKYYYKLGEVIAKDDYGFLHEVLYMDKWLAQVQKLKGTDKLADFEKQLKNLSNEEDKDSDVSEFSVGSLTKLHKAILDKSSSIFVQDSGTVVPESRNCSSGGQQQENTDNEGKNNGFSGKTNNMNYKISPSSKEEVYIRKKAGAKKNSQPPFKNEQQPALFTERPQASDVFENAKLHLNTNLAKVHSAILKTIKIAGDEKTRSMLNAYLSEKTLRTISLNDNEYWTKTWEIIARNRKKLTPARALSTSAFLYSWWIFHTLDTNKPSARKNPAKIKAVMASYVSNVTDNLDDVLLTFNSMRTYAKKKSSKLIFAQPSHLYKALETYFTYTKEHKTNSNTRSSRYSSRKDSTSTDEPKFTGLDDFINPELVLKETELLKKKDELASKGIDCQKYVLDQEYEPPADILKWGTEEHIKHLEQGMYTPSFSTVTPPGIRLKLAVLGYLDDTFFLPLPKYRRLAETVRGVPYDCWEHVDWRATGSFYMDRKREYDKALSKGEEFAKLRVWCLLKRYADATLDGGGFIHKWNRFDPEMVKPCTREEEDMYKTIYMRNIIDAED